MSAELQGAIDALATRPVAEPLALIGGEWRAALSGATLGVSSPIDGAHLAKIPACTHDDVDAAVAAARTAFEDGRWSRQAPKARKRLLLRWADLLQENARELAVLETRDMGMPVGMSLNANITGAIECIRWYAECIDKVYDEVAPLPENETAIIRRMPLGVIGAIVPWNFPVMLAAWKLGPALATGNSVVLKPAEDATLATIRMAELALEAGLPEGVLNVVPGLGADAGRALGEHMDVDAITFTGSGAVGRLLMEYAARSNMKRVSLECGGKTANIVMADAPDLDKAAVAAAAAICKNQGQICNAGSRLLVQRPIHDAFVASVVEAARGYQPGNPLDLATTLGPIVNDSQLGKINDAVTAAESAGISLPLDGRGAGPDDPALAGGSYIAPTIAAGVSSADPLAQEEVFGPVLATIPFDTLDEAIEIANGTKYGLGAAIWSADIDTVMKASGRLVAGTVFVNSFGGTMVELPFGGFRESGFGRDKSLHALDKYTDTRTVLIRHAV